ncbi:hypothetical protein GFO_2382 [Christiangramia forsetii KT0803]|uniref:Uncharacterized protein n=1 Tax=Christiangramia forsetii (strain DSM 17595 / CGMCC 1.15422 / KT0803) TaxID=411154 RepID=A0M3Z8_CHRFK|nr:hypothetical protein GFO_2382 [Christiangramia forsetii KT0803]
MSISPILPLFHRTIAETAKLMMVLKRLQIKANLKHHPKHFLKFQKKNF